MIPSYQVKVIDMLKIGCIIPKLAIICLHKSREANFYPFTEAEKDLVQKLREFVAVGLSIIFTCKAASDGTFIRKSTNTCKSIVGIDPSQLYFYSMCQPMPVGLHTGWDFNPHTSKLTLRQNKNGSFEKKVMSCSQRRRPDCKMENLHKTRR